MNQATEYAKILRTYFPYSLKGRAVKLADDTWATLEQEGNSKPDNISDIQNGLPDVHQGYYEELLKVSSLKGSKPLFFYGAIGDLKACAKSYEDGSRIVVLDSSIDKLLVEVSIATIICAYTRPSDVKVDEFRYFLETSILHFHKKPGHYNSEEMLGDFRMSFNEVNCDVCGQDMCLSFGIPIIIG